MGAAVRTAALLLVLAACSPLPVQAQGRFALVISGAAGGDEYAAQYAAWTDGFARTLVEHLHYERSDVVVLSETDDRASAASAENVRRVLGSLRARMGRNDTLLVLLIGHGTFDGTDAKFNLVGPDLDAGEWGALLKPLAGTVIVVNTTAGSFPFLERLGGPRRIVISATDSVAQRFDTVFPGFFIESFGQESADLDKNGRISIWEAFAAASAGVKRHYQARGQLSTERALLDDDGDGVGKAAAEEGADGAVAARTYLDENLPGAPPTDEELLKLLQRKSLIEAEVDDLKIRRAFLSREDYAKEFERLMIELARVSSEVRKRTKT
jgi:hypothetical protein